MSTFAQLVTAVRDEISEPTPGFVSDTELKRWLNRANYDLTDAAGIESASSQSIATVASTETYALAADAGLVEQIELVDSSNSTLFTILAPVSVVQRIDGTGSPIAYYVNGSNLYVVPIPDGAYTLRVWYTRSGVTLVGDTDVPIIPAKYHDLLTLFAISQAKRKSDDPAYLTYLQDYVAGRDGMIAYLRTRGKSGNRRIVSVDTDTGADGL